jgi:uncharacterized protein (DUF305 family)
MRPSSFTAILIGLSSALSAAVPALAQMPGGMDHGGHHGMPGMAMPGTSTPADMAPAHAGHAHDIGQPGVGALGKAIWRDQADEIRAMGLWRKSWYPQAPVYPVALASGGDPNSLSGLIRMSQTQIDGMRMIGEGPTRENRVTWFLEGMLQHHGGALIMAHDALVKSTNPTIRRFATGVIVAQRAEIIQLRRMLALEGLRKPEYSQYDALFSL